MVDNFIEYFLCIIFVLLTFVMQKTYLVFSTVINLIGSAMVRVRLLGQDISGSMSNAGFSVDYNSLTPLCSF